MKLAEMKTFEIRDRGTFVPALAVQLNPSNEDERRLLGRAGFGRLPSEHRQYIFLIKLTDAKCEWDPIEWGDRTMLVAHKHIVDFWRDLRPGEVVDVEFILGETTTKKEPER